LVYPGTTLPVCSGVLVRSSTYGAVFLTAAHCLPDARGRSASGRAARVTFASAVSPVSRFYAGTYYGDPDYTGAANDPHDLAVVVFSHRPPIPALRLAPVGALSALSGLKKSDFTVVGYGFPTLGVRQHSTERGQRLTAHWLDLVPDPNGPACEVDSGGPALLRHHGRTYVTATTIGGDQTCQRFDQDLRVDTVAAHRYVNEAHT
jgi:secreted trypsin-like serine protease